MWINPEFGSPTLDKEGNFPSFLMDELLLSRAEVDDIWIVISISKPLQTKLLYNLNLVIIYFRVSF